MVDSREPPNGDFVAFVEQIEREQLARAMRPHKLPHLSTGGKVVTEDAGDPGSRALSASEAQRVLQTLGTKGAAGAKAPLGAMVGLFLGAALIAFGLMAEGGIVLVLLGAALLWHSLRRLHRMARTTADSTGHRVDRAFGNRASGTTHERRT